MAPKRRTNEHLLRQSRASKIRQARDRKYAKIYHEPVALRFHNGLRLAIREKRHYKWLQHFRLANAFMIQVGAQFGAYQWVGHQVLRWGLVEAAALWFQNPLKAWNIYCSIRMVKNVPYILASDEG